MRTLAAAPIHRASRAGSSPIVLHASGDLVMVAEGLLRVGPQGETRWHLPDGHVVDVGTTPDGSIYGLALVQPGGRAGRVRLTRYRADGSIEWQHAFRKRHDPFSVPQVEGAADGGAFVCRSTANGSRPVPVLDRLDSTGRVVWSIRLASEGQCHALDADGSGHVAWAGARAVTRTFWAGVVERVDASGRVVWSQTFEGRPNLREVALASDGSVSVAGEFEDDLDLLPGPRTQLAHGNGYTTFTTRFDAAGTATWARSSDRLEGAAALLRRAHETIVIGQNYMTRLDDAGRVVQRETFGCPVHDGVRSVPLLTVSAATLDARGAVVISGGLPEPGAIAFAPYYLWSSQPYTGVRGAVLARPGW